MFSNTLKNLLAILIDGDKKLSFISTLSENTLFSYTPLYRQMGLNPAAIGSKNKQTILEFRYNDHLQLKQLLKSTFADILIFWAPLTEVQKKLYPAILYSLWQILEQCGFNYVICYYQNDDSLSLGLTEKCLENIPLLIVIHKDLFTKVQPNLVDYLLNNQKDQLKKQPKARGTEEQMDKLLQFNLERYKILQIPIYHALTRIKNDLDANETQQIKKDLVLIQQKMDELAYFFRLAFHKKYAAISYEFPHAVWQNSFLHRIIQFWLGCKEFCSPKLGRLYHYPGKLLKHKPTSLPQLDPEKLPSISIVTPSFNQGLYIERTIKSVLDQNYPKLEYVIQDGLSTDNATDVLRKYEKKLTHWESIKDNGQSQAINLGFTHCNGEIMAYLNSDDLLLPGSLQYIGQYFKEHPDVDVVYGHRVLIDEDDLEIGRWVLPPHSNMVLSWADYIPQETLFWRRSLWEKMGPIDESFKFAMDWDLILRFRDVGATFKRLPKFIGAFRVHAAQKTSAVITSTGEQEMARLRYRCLQYDPSHSTIRKHIFPYLLKHLFYHKLYRASILHYD